MGACFLPVKVTLKLDRDQICQGVGRGRGKGDAKDCSCKRTFVWGGGSEVMGKASLLTPRGVTLEKLLPAL